MTRPLARRAGLPTAALAAVLAAVLSLVGTAPPAPVSAMVPSAATSPQQEQPGAAALDAVQAVFGAADGAAARTASGVGPVGRDATLALRDLARYAGSLPPAERAEAESWLARPTAGGGDRVAGAVVRYDAPEAPPVCNDDLCVHYVTTTSDAPPLADDVDAAGDPGVNGVPDYVDTVLRTVTDVHDTYLRAGYREPLGDGRRGGGTDLIDLYLADIGRLGLYGYCATDQPDPPRGSRQFYDRWAYCTLDDDYTGFPAPPLESLQVTAAHEYFHATQYAYDAFEDAWLLEATATWAEDQLYDDVDDNVQYLRRGPMTTPSVPLDTFVLGGRDGGFQYGTWSFIRFLAEQFPADRGGMPRLVLDLVERTDGSLGARDLFSLQALASVLRRRGTTLAGALLGYAVANRHPGLVYEEGASQAYPTAPLRDTFTLSPRRRDTGAVRVRTDHLTSATYRIEPRRLAQPRTRLQVVVDLGARRTDSLAAVVTTPASGQPVTRVVDVDRSGAGSVTLPFGSDAVRHVEVTVVNGSARTSCFDDTRSPYSCFGDPADDDLVQQLRARVVR